MRREFTKATKREAYARSGGVCECHRIPSMAPGCGLPLGGGNTFYEHIIQCEVGGDGSLENCAVLTKTCWKLKTAKYDQPVIAKCRRVGDRYRGIVTRRGRSIPYRKFDGTPVKGG